EALASIRKSSAAVVAHAHIEAGSAQRGGGAKGLVEQRADYFRDHVAILSAAIQQGLETEAALTREGFEIAQWAGQATAAGALAQLARERQDLERQWRAVDQRLNGAVAKGDVALSARLRGELSSLNAKFAAIDARLAREFPDYAALSNPKPMSIADA